MKYAFLILIITAAVLVSTAQRAESFAPSSMRTAAELYSKNCASCHGKDGRAKTLKAKFNHARNLTDATWQNEASDERIFNSIMNGRGKKMPASGKKFSEQEINSLVTFVRGLKR